MFVRKMPSYAPYVPAYIKNVFVIMVNYLLCTIIMVKKKNGKQVSEEDGETDEDEDEEEAPMINQCSCLVELRPKKNDSQVLKVLHAMFWLQKDTHVIQHEEHVSRNTSMKNLKETSGSVAKPKQ